MKYETLIIDYAPKARAMAAAVEEETNKMAQQGYELVTMSITNSAKAILVFKTDAGPQLEAETEDENEAPAVDTEE